MDTSESLPPELEKFWRTDDGLTASQRAAAYGIDLSLIDDNLRLSPSERMDRNDAILNEADFLRAAYLKSHEGTDTHHQTAR